MELAPEQAGLSPERLDRITRPSEPELHRAGQDRRLPGVVARHGHVAYFQSLGRMDLERDARWRTTRSSASIR